MDLKFTLNLNISNILTSKELLAINSIGFALVVLSLKSRLTYLISPNYHNDQYIRDLAYPTVVFINRITYWGIFFIFSIIIQLSTFLEVLQDCQKSLLNFAFLLTASAFLTLFVYYIQYLIGTRFRDWWLLNRWKR